MCQQQWATNLGISGALWRQTIIAQRQLYIARPSPDPVVSTPEYVSKKGRFFSCRVFHDLFAAVIDSCLANRLTEKKHSEATNHHFPLLQEVHQSNTCAHFADVCACRYDVRYHCGQQSCFSGKVSLFSCHWFSLPRPPPCTLALPKHLSTDQCISMLKRSGNRRYLQKFRRRMGETPVGGIAASGQGNGIHAY